MNNQLQKIICLSIREPWASAIADGHKTIEVRYWKHLRVPEYPAVIGIHAALKYCADDLRDFEYCTGKTFKISECSLGAIIALVEFTGVINYDAYPHYNSRFVLERSKHLNDLKLLPSEREEGQVCYGLKFENARRIKPIFTKGQLGFFKREIDIQYTSPGVTPGGEEI
jgi:ASCH domain